MRSRMESVREEGSTAKLRHHWVPYSRISIHLKRAVIAAEDATFMEHDGFDWKGIRNAYERNLREGEVVAGGSTISQQLAKNLFLTGERAWWRKAQEAAITVMIELIMDKRRILEIYLNVIEWGELVFGAEAAARYHFGVAAADLSPEQAARLAAMVPNPRKYGPGAEYSLSSAANHDAPCAYERCARALIETSCVLCATAPFAKLTIVPNPTRGARMHRRTFLAALAATGAAGVAHANDPSRILLAQAIPAQRRSPDVIFVPTPNEVVQKMLELAKVTPNDVVYDLGCGDGRIVITAAQKYGARAVGVDIDPQRISEATANAKAARVTDKVKFIEGDLFETDISEASVVTLYLLTRLNEKLKPKLLKELRPGTRVVSHAFDMGDWKPEETASVSASSVYLWRIPAAGKG